MVSRGLLRRTNPLLVSFSPAERTLIVHSHPIKDSFSVAVAHTVADALKARPGNCDVRVRQLYSMPDGKAFNPITSESERAGYFVENQQPQLKEDPHVIDLVDSLRWADSLVLVYPTWWFGLPAMMKGFFDRCFVPGVGFKYDHALGKRTTGLQNIQRLGVVTSYGFDEPTVAKAGDAGRVQIHGGMTMLFHPECEKTWDALYSMQAAQTADQRAEFLTSVRSRFEKW